MTTNTQLNIPKGDGNAAHYLDGSGNYSTPAGSGGSYKNIQISSSSSGAFTTTSGSLTAITNLTVTITTTGGPVDLSLQSASTSNVAYIGNSLLNSGTQIAFFRGVTQLNLDQMSAGTSSYVPPGSFQFTDTPTAGTYTYTAQMAVTQGTGSVNYCNLVAMEI